MGPSGRPTAMQRGILSVDRLRFQVQIQNREVRLTAREAIQHVKANPTTANILMHCRPEKIG